jgi:anti-sigma regulatory factor (Ser/Thr protein kinase)
VCYITTVASHATVIHLKGNRMKEVEESYIANIGIHDTSTGDVIGEIPAIHSVKNKYYNIKRLNMMIWDEGLNEVMEAAVSSKTDMKLFIYIKSLIDKNGQLIINQTHLADQFNINRVTVARFIKKLIKAQFIHKQAPTVYIINPFIIRPKGMSNEDCEAAQEYWANIYGIPEKK